MSKRNIFNKSVLLLLLQTIFIVGCGSGPNKSDVEREIRKGWEGSPAYEILKVKNSSEIRFEGGMKYIPSTKESPVINNIEIEKWGDISEKGDKQIVTVIISGTVKVHDLYDTKEHADSQWGFLTDIKEIDKGTENFTVTRTYTFVKDEFGKWH